MSLIMTSRSVFLKGGHDDGCGRSLYRVRPGVGNGCKWIFYEVSPITLLFVMYMSTLQEDQVSSTLSHKHTEHS